MSKNNKYNYKQLIKSGRLEQCEICGCVDCMGKPLKLQVHHRDGNRDNNDLNNLQILCPNCHSQTDTWCAKNRKEKIKEIYFCNSCGKQLCEKSKTGLCKKCHDNFQKSLSKNPGEAVLRQDCEELKSYSAIGRKYNVCSKTIKKWCKNFGFTIETLQ